MTYIRINFGHCHVTFPLKEILSFFGPCHVAFPYTEPLSFLVGLYKKYLYLVFHNHLLRKRRNNQMAAVRLQAISSFYTNYSENSLVISAYTYENYFVSKE